MTEHLLREVQAMFKKQKNVKVVVNVDATGGKEELNKIFEWVNDVADRYPDMEIEVSIRDVF